MLRSACFFGGLEVWMRQGGIRRGSRREGRSSQGVLAEFPRGGCTGNAGRRDARLQAALAETANMQSFKSRTMWAHSVFLNRSDRQTAAFVRRDGGVHFRLTIALPFPQAATAFAGRENAVSRDVDFQPKA